MMFSEKFRQTFKFWFLKLLTPVISLIGAAVIIPYAQDYYIEKQAYFEDKRKMVNTAIKNLTDLRNEFFFLKNDCQKYRKLKEKTGESGSAEKLRVESAYKKVRKDAITKFLNDAYAGYFYLKKENIERIEKFVRWYDSKTAICDETMLAGVFSREWENDISCHILKDVYGSFSGYNCHEKFN